MHNIEFNVEKKWEILIPEYKKIILNAVKKTYKEVFNITKPNIELSVFLTSNKKIQKLNQEYRNKDKPTNVLSFPMGSISGDNSVLIGDIVIALETIISEAKKLKISRKNYLSKITIHGLLHLLGYDHIEQNDFIKMDKIEKNIIKKIN